MSLLQSLRRLVSKAGKDEPDAPGPLARFKAMVLGTDVGAVESALHPDEGQMALFGQAGALEPPLPFDQIAVLLTTSNSLRQNIDAYVTNIESAGWRPVPTIDLWGPEASRAVREQLVLMHDGAEPTDQDVAEALKTWKREALIERARMVRFFEYLNPDETFTAIRKKLRMDHELFGNSALEFGRNRNGNLALVSHVQFAHLRALPLDQPVKTEMRFKSDAITIDTLTVYRRFRRYVQVQAGLMVYFKELGDPRVVSGKTGTVFANVEEGRAKEGADFREANELLHRKIYVPGEVYGLGRWIGNLFSVMGSRASEEVNYLYFENKSVPPMAIIVSGGRLTTDSVSILKSFIENDIRGKGNFHKILVIQAESEAGDTKNTGRAQIKIQPLTDAQLQDALFQRYDRNNIDKVGASFRLPGVLRGDIRDAGRGAIEPARGLAEQQVFGPERDDVDSDINRKILPRLGIRYWTFRTRMPMERDVTVVSDVLNSLVANGIVMPDEARAMLPEIGLDVKPRDDEFLKRPMRLAIAELRANAGPAAAAEPTPTPDPAAAAAEAAAAKQRELAAQAKDLAVVKAMMDSAELREEVIKMPRAEWEKIFKEDT